MPSKLAWKFTNQICERRRDYLLQAPSYQEIIAEFINQACSNNISTKLEPGNRRKERPDLEGCKRPEFKMQVSSKIGDLFFNSCNGYRAAYCESREKGECANKSLIATLKSTMIDAWRKHDTQGLEIESAIRSLDHETAKVWPDETHIGVNGWITYALEIDHPIWTRNALTFKLEIDRHVAAGEAFYRNQRDETRLPFWGIRAPLCVWFEIKGAWLAEDGSIRPGKSPEARAKDIQNFGWS